MAHAHSTNRLGLGKNGEEHIFVVTLTIESKLIFMFLKCVLMVFYILIGMTKVILYVH